MDNEDYRCPYPRPSTVQKISPKGEISVGRDYNAASDFVVGIQALYRAIDEHAKAHLKRAQMNFDHAAEDHSAVAEWLAQNGFVPEETAEDGLLSALEAQT